MHRNLINEASAVQRAEMIRRVGQLPRDNEITSWLREARVPSASVSNFLLVPVPLEGTIGNQNRRRLCAKNQRSTKPVAVVEAQGRIAAFPQRLARQLHSGCCCCCCVSPGNSPVNFPATRRGRRKIGRGTGVPREKQVALLQNLMYISFIIILGITCLAAVTKSGILYIARAQRVLVAIRRPSPNGASEGGKETLGND